MRLFVIFLFVWFLSLSSQALAQTKIVVWNAQASLEEKASERLKDYREFANFTNANVIVLIEMSGETSVRDFVETLDWSEAYYVTSDFSKLSTNVFFALEMAVISKHPIQQVIEYDTSPDGVHPVHFK